VVTTHRRELVAAVRELVGDPEAAERMGRAAREHALTHFGLGRFLEDWDVLLDATVTGARAGSTACPA
jgi:glycosyltransferase involved in cell wall biosynthesis